MCARCTTARAEASNGYVYDTENRDMWCFLVSQSLITPGKQRRIHNDVYQPAEVSIGHHAEPSCIPVLQLAQGRGLPSVLSLR